jgi:succinate-acetate transporter protein
MESIHKEFEEIVSGVEKAAQTKLEIWKLKLTVIASETISSVFSMIVIILILTVTFLMLSVAAALKIGKYLGDTGNGFLIVAGIDTVLIFLCIVFRNQLFKTPVKHQLIKKMFTPDEP